MDNFTFSMISALWFGVLTSISPCPLTTNIAAISFISRNIGSPKKSVAAGLIYTLGRVLTYVVIGAVLVSSLTRLPVCLDSSRNTWES